MIYFVFSTHLQLNAGWTGFTPSSDDNTIIPLVFQEYLDMAYIPYPSTSYSMAGYAPGWGYVPYSTLYSYWTPPVPPPQPSKQPFVQARPSLETAQPDMASAFKNPGLKSSVGASQWKAPPKKDIWRDTPLRYAGYLNELAASWKQILRLLLGPRWGHVAFHALDKATPVYAALDALDKGRIMLKEGKEQGIPDRERRKNALLAIIDAGAFQAGASVFIPVVVVQFVRDTSARFMQHNRWIQTNPMVRQVEKNLLRSKVPMRVLVPALASSAIIPFIIHPIDWMVDQGVNHAVHPAAQLMLDQWIP